MYYGNGWVGAIETIFTSKTCSSQNKVESGLACQHKINGNHGAIETIFASKIRSSQHKVKSDLACQHKLKWAMVTVCMVP